MSRKLATIRAVSELKPIDGRDRIVLATVDGWHVIVGKDDFEVGDMCVYCEPDTVLPETPEFEFLRKRDFRIKTMKMAGVISQGICFTMDILPPGNYAVGDDVTQIIGATQYEPTMDDADTTNVNDAPKRKYPKWLMRHTWFRKLVLPPSKSKSWPNFVSKTDEERIQNCKWILEDNEHWVATEKVDGTSATYVIKKKSGFHPFHKYEYFVCSRNRRLPTDDGSVYWQIYKECNIAHALETLIADASWADWVVIQGEIIGPKIQGNKYKLGHFQFYVFNLIYPNRRVPSIEAKHTINDSCHLKFVPIVNSEMKLPDTVDDMLKIARGKSQINTSIYREGLVCRSLDGKQSFKAVDPLFLIKYNE